MGVPALSVHETAFLHAETGRWDGMGSTLHVRRSVAVRDSDWVLDEVWDYLRTWCHTLIHPAIVEKDPGMMMGKAEITRYSVHVECPGPRAEHQCVKDEKGMAA